MTESLRLLSSVFKLRIGVAIMLSALAGLAVAPGPAPGAWKVVLLAAVVLASSASVGAFNQIVERELDARMARTRNRPFVTGRFRAGWREWASLVARRAWERPRLAERAVPNRACASASPRSPAPS